MVACAVFAFCFLDVSITGYNGCQVTLVWVLPIAFETLRFA